MIELEEFEKLLGASGKDLSQEELEEVRSKEYEIADAVIDWLHRKRDTSEPENLEYES